MKSLFIVIFVIIFGTNCVSAQEEISDVSFLIIHSTKNYDSALKIAKEASKKLELKLNLRGYYEDKIDGLDTDEKCGCGELHGYLPRGRFDNGDFISIEYTNSYEEFVNGFYIVVTSSGDKKELIKSLNKVKDFYNDAYIKEASVYVGCMH